MIATNHLQAVLRRMGSSGAAELRMALGVSPATLSRLVERAGTQVQRMGRGRATRYAATRLVAGLGPRAPVFRIDTEGRVEDAGLLHFLAQGQHWWMADSGAGTQYRGVPPELVDMAPQGFIGRQFPHTHPDLGLPPRIADWSDDHRLIALARRGEDCVGDLVIGDESLARLTAAAPVDFSPADYARLAEAAVRRVAGSSAGGEHPKFGVLSGGRHVLVKFATDTSAPSARRRRELLWCEWKALEMITASGRQAARARIVDVPGLRCLEVERFDRIGVHGRRAVLSLAAIDDEFFGTRDSWTAMSQRLGARPFLLSEPDAATLRWLDVFGELIGNDDRHFGNVTFYTRPGPRLVLAPAFDMLPMMLAPVDDALVVREFTPLPPRGDNLDVWPDAASWALRYWAAVAEEKDLHADLRTFASKAAMAIEALSRRVRM